MEFRRGGHRDERRRRALIDEPEVSDPAASVASAGRSESVSPSSEPARRYTDAALSPRQLRVVDLIPTRWWTNLVLSALVLSCVAGIEALYGYLALGYTDFDVSQFPAINLAERGSVATWFSSAMLATCAIFGLLIYQIRRHRADDYRGRYRMWCWIVPVFLLASIDQVAGIQESVRTAFLHTASLHTASLHIAGIFEFADATLVWVASVAFVTAAIGVRLIMEMRACRMASVMLLISLAGLAAMGATQGGWLPADVSILRTASIFRTMAIAGFTMGAHIALLMAMFLYARHVYRDASGQLRPTQAQKHRKVRKRSLNNAVAEEPTSPPSESRRPQVRREAGKNVRTARAHTTSSKKSSGDNSQSSTGTPSNGDRSTRKEKRRVTADASTTAKPSTSSLCEPDDEQTEESSKLSKAERKRQRKLRRRERQV